MTTAGLILSIASFAVFFGLLDTMLQSGFLCLVMALAAITGLCLVATGYSKSFKLSKNNARTLKDRLKLLTSCFMGFMVALVAYHILFKRPGLPSLIYALPAILIVMLFVWLAGLITILVKMKAAKANTISTACSACGHPISPSMDYCGHCGAPLHSQKKM